MEPKNLIYTTNYQIYPKDSDYKKDIRPGALINYFIQSSWLHAEELGFGYSHLLKDGIGWVLSRFHIVIDKMPGWPGEFRLETWPKGIDRILYLRDAEVFDSKNNRLAILTSSWLVIDMETKRPRRSLPQADSFTGLKVRDAIEEPARGLEFSGTTAYSEQYKVRYNDIDVNEHLTTYRYIDFVFDTYDIDFLNTHTPREITVNFLKEVPYGADLIMKRIEDSNIHQFELVNTDTGAVCFRAEVKY
jgi:acyl-ACP thioesterase